MENLLDKAAELIGVTKLAGLLPGMDRRTLGRHRQAGTLPLTDLTGETKYFEVIEQETKGEITRVQLLTACIPYMVPGIVYKLPAAMFKPDPNQPRKQFRMEELEELALTLGNDGQESPIKFRLSETDEAPLTIVHGERRWRSVQVGNIEDLTCLLDDKTDTPAERVFRQLTDNTGKPLTQWDLACTIKYLHEDQGLKHQDIANELSARGIKDLGRSACSNLYRIFKLPKAAQNLIEAEWLTPSHGKILLSIKHKDALGRYIAKLTNSNSSGGIAPPLSRMIYEIADTYDATFPNLDGEYGDGKEEWYPVIIDTTQCKGCKHAYTFSLDDDIEDTYCTDTTCYEAKQQAQAAENAKAAVDEPHMDGAEEPKEPPGTPSIPPKTAATRDAARKAEDQQRKQQQQAWERQRKAWGELMERTKQAISAAPVETLDLLLVYSGLINEDDITLADTKARMDINPNEVKKAAAVASLEFYMDNTVREIAKALNVPLDVSQETRQQDLLEANG